MPSQLLSIPFRNFFFFFEEMLALHSTTQREEAQNTCSLFYMFPNYSISGLRKFLPLLIRLRTSIIIFIVVKLKTETLLGIIYKLHANKERLYI